MLNKLRKINWKYELKGLAEIAWFIAKMLIVLVIIQNALWVIVTGHLAPVSLI